MTASMAPGTYICTLSATLYAELTCGGCGVGCVGGGVVECVLCGGGV